MFCIVLWDMDRSKLRGNTSSYRNFVMLWFRAWLLSLNLEAVDSVGVEFTVPFIS